MDKLPVRHGDGPARRALDVDGPTHRSFAKLESNGRPFRTVEIRVLVRSLWPGLALFQDRRQLFKHPLRADAKLIFSEIAMG